MKKLLPIFILLSPIMVVAQSNTSWYKVYKGTLDKYPITMHLHQTEKAVKGYYYYDSKQIPISVMGDNTASKIKLENNEENGETFELTLNTNTLIGTWKKGTKKLNVNLSEVSQAIDFDMIYAKGDQKMFPKWKENSPTADYFQASVWPKANNALDVVIKKEIRKSFDEKNTSNDDIGKIFLKQKREFFDEFVGQKPTEQEAKEMSSMYMRSLTDELLVMYQSPKTLTLAHTIYTYTGGAHGNYGTSYSSFDISTSKRLSLKDVFTPTGLKQLEPILEKYYRQAYKVKPTESLTDSGLFENKVPTTDNFYLTNTGIGFSYTPYEIGPYAMGQIEFFIPFADIKSVLQPNFK